MLAQFRGICGACTEPIAPGDQIIRDESEWVHALCPEATADRADAQALQAPRCTRCGLNHPGEC